VIKCGERGNPACLRRVFRRVGDDSDWMETPRGIRVVKLQTEDSPAGGRVEHILGRSQPTVGSTAGQIRTRSSNFQKHLSQSGRSLGELAIAFLVKLPFSTLVAENGCFNHCIVEPVQSDVPPVLNRSPVCSDRCRCGLISVQAPLLSMPLSLCTDLVVMPCSILRPRDLPPYILGKSED